jgi:hypothetical protein
MPVLNPALIQDVRSKLDAEFGPIPSNLLAAEKQTLEAFRQHMAVTIAQAAVHVRDNAVVNSNVTVVPGIAVQVAVPAGTGATTSPGSGTAVGTIT